ncbi:inositol monophosphatase family protein [Micromonospora sp. KC721]|uniref:inositol monophosphatase family protein n=1 Tax=Micromonospora sp. KC721 TaxID=2530380 RepID=UPI001051250E|nr:inositol monophosphatase family protein [Micromonospora sp. KC721]TDB82474.1 inositol monophosphatase [Micromonospora sp. KC721]
MTLPAPPLANADLNELLALGIDLAVRAGEAIGAEHDGRRSLRVKSTPTDHVTAADLASDAAIRAGLARRRPRDGILCEDGDDIESATGLRWVVDSLDGTVNHVHGVPHTSVSIACEAYVGRVWSAAVAVVLDVARGELFTAVRGGGSRLDDRPIGVTDPVPIGQALVATEFGYSSESRQRQAVTLARVAPLVGDVRATGSSALDLCWTAAGRLDGYYEDELSRWDWAAGRLIVEEAGGIVTELGAGVLAAGPQLHRAMRSLLDAAA